jgi:hypothetical protein
MAVHNANLRESRYGVQHLYIHRPTLLRKLRAVGLACWFPKLTCETVRRTETV